MIKFCSFSLAGLLCLALASSFTYVTAPVTYLRMEPKDIGEIESQAFYSEQVEVLDSSDDWLHVKMSDQEIGWLKKSTLTNRPQPYPSPDSLTVRVNRLAAHLYHIMDTTCGPISTLPFDSLLEVVEQPDGPNGRWLCVKGPDSNPIYIQRGDVSFQQQVLKRDEIAAFSKNFLGLPYTWGGRASFGYDCSGFVQMLYRHMGIAIPRNSRDQVAWKGFRPVAFNELQPGDLVFFGSASKVTHVGMYIGDGEFIHSSIRENLPYLRISKLFSPPWDGSAPFTSYRVARTLL